MTVCQPTACPGARPYTARAARYLAVGATVLIGLTVANCSQAPRSASRLSSQEAREIGAFSQRKFGAASPRVVANGQPVPKGGGRDHIGRSYTIAGKRYTPYNKPVGYTVTGSASWYGAAFHGRKTANGEIYDRHGISAAHPTMPLPSYARVTNLGNRRSIIVRINDRGPYHGGRIIDLSQRTAELLDYRHIGTARVKVEYLGRASLAGSDDRLLMATLTTDGSPASMPGMSTGPVMVASAPPLASPRALPSSIEAPIERPAAPAPTIPQTVASGQASLAVPAALDRAGPADGQGASRRIIAAPYPPERPFDLATIPGAATPLAFAGAAPGARRAQPALSEARPVVASLFYAPPSLPASRFAPGHPLAAGLTAQRFVPLRR